MFLNLLSRVKVDLVRIYLQVTSGDQVTVNKGQWWRPAKFLCIFDTGFRSQFSQ